MKKARRVLQQGERVRLRGRNLYGDIVVISGKWVRLDWIGERGPGIVHLDELEPLSMYPDDGGLKDQVRKFEDTFGIAQLLKKEFFEKK